MRVVQAGVFELRLWLAEQSTGLQIEFFDFDMCGQSTGALRERVVQRFKISAKVSCDEGAPPSVDAAEVRRRRWVLGEVAVLGISQVGELKVREASWERPGVDDRPQHDAK
jgi:hypothetical protein